MTATAKETRARVLATMRTLAEINDSLDVADEDWGDVQDEIETARQHLEWAQRMLSSPDEAVA